MKDIYISAIYVGFFGLIAFVVYLTGSAWPLWALLLTPSYKSRTEHKCPSCGYVFVNKDDDDDDDDEK